jgi:glutathione S-transferase
MATKLDDELDDLSAAILIALAETHGAEVSLPRLTKRLGAGASVLMRQLTLMSDATIGGVAGPGWVKVMQADGRWIAALTEPGRARAAAHAGRWNPGC